MNSYNTLLEWASEIGGGSWLSWRDACAHLGVGASSAARNLAALGHVEFDWIDSRFAVAPKAAVFTLHSSGCLLLTGARRRGMRHGSRRHLLLHLTDKVRKSTPKRPECPGRFAAVRVRGLGRDGRICYHTG